MYIKNTCGRICQGDIYRDMPMVSWAYEEDNKTVEISQITLIYAVVITQDCDLESDFRNHSNESSEKHDKYLPSILLCPAYLAQDFRKGNHLDELGFKMESWNSSLYKTIKNQNNPRFHFLDSSQNNQVPELVVDFKHYYTIPREVLYSHSGNYLASLAPLFRERISQRFSNYLCRIGLPSGTKEGMIEAVSNGH